MRGATGTCGTLSSNSTSVEVLMVTSCCMGSSEGCFSDSLRRVGTGGNLCETGFVLSLLGVAWKTAALTVSHSMTEAGVPCCSFSGSVCSKSLPSPFWSGGGGEVRTALNSPFTDLANVSFSEHSGALGGRGGGLLNLGGTWIGVLRLWVLKTGVGEVGGLLLLHSSMKIGLTYQSRSLPMESWISQELLCPGLS